MRVVLVSYHGYDAPGVIHAHYFANHLVEAGHQVLLLLNGSVATADWLKDPPRYAVLEIAFRGGLLVQHVHTAAVAFAPDIIHLWTPRHVPCRVGLELWEATSARLVIHHEDDEEYVLSQAHSNTHFGPDDLALYRLFSRESCTDEELTSWIARVDREALRETLLVPETWQAVHPLITPVVEKLADGHTAISPTYRRLLQTRYRSPVELLYPGVDLDFFSPRPRPPALLESQGLRGRTLLLHSGRVARYHDLASLFRALPLVVNRHPNLVLVHVGWNLMPEELRLLVNDLRLQDHVRLLDPVPHAEVPDHLSLADAFVAPVRPGEFNAHRLPAKVPEYMAMGRPLIVTAVGVGQELDDPSEVVKVSSDAPEDLAQGLERLLLLRPCWDDMGRRLRKKASVLFNWQANTARLLAFYQHVRDQPRTSAAESDPTSALQRLESLGWLPQDGSPSAHSTFRPANAAFRRRKVLILTEGLIGPQMSGTGIRYFEIARALAPHLDVTLGQPHPTVRPIDGVVFFEWRPTEPRQALEHARQADVVLIHGYVLQKMPELRNAAKRLVVDLYCPFVFENIDVHRDRGLAVSERDAIHYHDLDVICQQLLVADYVLCCHERQRHWILGILTALNRLRPGTADAPVSPDSFVGLVPFGLPDEPPPPSSAGVIKGNWPGVKEGDFVALWGGGLWSWLDPVTVIKGMASVARQRPDVKLLFMSTRTADQVIDMPVQRRALSVAGELGLLDRSVLFNHASYVDYDARTRYYSDADVGVCAHHQTLEAHFAYRSRLLDYLYVDLPIITSRGDWWSEEVDQHQLGTTVGIGDADAWAAALLEAAAAPGELHRCRQRIAQRKSRYTWQTCVRPLLDYCLADPTPATTRTTRFPLWMNNATGQGAARQAQRTRQLERELSNLRRQYDLLAHYAAGWEAKVALAKRLPLAAPLWRLSRRVARLLRKSRPQS